MALSPDGHVLVTSSRSYSGTMVWDFASGAVLQELDLLGRSLAFSPDGEWLAVGIQTKDDVGVRLFRTRN